MDILRSHDGSSSAGTAARTPGRIGFGRSVVFRVAAGVLLSTSLAACAGTVSGTALPDPAALASAAIGQIPTDLSTDIGAIPTDPGQLPTEEGGTPAEPGASEDPDAGEPDATEPDAGEPDVPEATEVPADPGTEVPDFGDIPEFGELPEDWPADIVLPEGAVVNFGFSDETGITALFTVPGSTVADLGTYFESSLPAAGYSADQTGEFSGVYSGIFTKDGKTVTVGILDLGGEVTATITISPSS